MFFHADGGINGYQNGLIFSAVDPFQRLLQIDGVNRMIQGADDGNFLPPYLSQFVAYDRAQTVAGYPVAADA